MLISRSGTFDGSAVPALVLKLEAFTRLSTDDRAALARISRNVRTLEARGDLLCEGERPRHVHLVVDGWACRYKELPDGKRQVVSLLLAGDFCDLKMQVLRRMDHSVCAISRLKVATIAPEEVTGICADHPRIAHALWWNELVDAAIQREWTINLGQRSAQQRLAHLLIELYLRLQAVGRANDGRCDFPLTQNDLADALGLTAVHVNRTLQQLRRKRLIELEHKQLNVLDLPRLMEMAMFSPDYLHLDRDGRHLDAKNSPPSLTI